jgi:hypothetical protein
LGLRLLAHHNFDLNDQREYKLCDSFVLATSIAAVFNAFPILRPLLAPFEFEATARTNFWQKAILNLCDARHCAIVGESR